MEFTKHMAELLLKDETTGKPIYKAMGDTEEEFYEPMTAEKGMEGRRYGDLTRKEQKGRSAKKAEVYTPLEAVRQMTDLIWKDPKSHHPSFRWLEITCGSAPFITTLYDSYSLEPVPEKERAGILDRKFREIAPIDSNAQWLPLAILSLSSVYGYEWQGESLFWARRNVLTCFLEAYGKRYEAMPPDGVLEQICEIIRWNFWQMDGLSGCLPDFHKNGAELGHGKMKSAKAKKAFYEGLTPCLIKDWSSGEVGKFLDLLHDGDPKQPKQAALL